jgi:hypothetical protein
MRKRAQIIELLWLKLAASFFASEYRGKKAENERKK